MSIKSATMMSGVIAALFTAGLLLDIFTPLGLPIFILNVVPLALASWFLVQRLGRRTRS